MNVRLQPMKVLSIFLLLSVSSSYPMEWLKQKAQNIRNYFPKTQEAIMPQITQWQSAATPTVVNIGGGAVAVGGLGFLGYLAAKHYLSPHDSNPVSHIVIADETLENSNFVPLHSQYIDGNLYIQDAHLYKNVVATQEQINKFASIHNDLEKYHARAKSKKSVMRIM